MTDPSSTYRPVAMFSTFTFGLLASSRPVPTTRASTQHAAQVALSRRATYPQSDTVSPNPRSELQQRRRRMDAKKGTPAILADLRLCKDGIMKLAVRHCHVGVFYLSIARRAYRPQTGKSMAWGVPWWHWTPPESAILGERDNASAKIAAGGQKPFGPKEVETMLSPR
jgi:hypothetical protein